MKKTLIYGGSGGIGRRVAELLVDRGTEVHLAGRNSQALSTVAQALGAAFTQGDAQDPGFFTKAAAEAGEIDGLVYAIGTINLKSLARFTPEELDRDFQVNARGAALAVAASLQSLKSHEGSSVVLFSSVAASQGFTNHVSVSLAKGAVSGLTLALAAELAPKVRVNALAPSLIRTPLAAALVSNPQVEAAIAGLHAIPRLGTVDDAASVVVFLLSDQSGWITGQILGIDGGRSSLRIRA